MATQTGPLQFKRGNSAKVNAYTPAIGEPVWDQTSNELIIGDGLTLGGKKTNSKFVETYSLESFKSPLDTDDTNAFTAAINLNNSLPRGIKLQLGSRQHVINVALPIITKPITIEGNGASKSSVLFRSLDGFKIDLSGMTVSGANSSELRNFTLTTNSQIQTGLTLIGQPTDCPGFKYVLDNIMLVPNARFTGPGEDINEWSTAILIGGPSNKTAEVELTDVAIFGSNLNDAYATRTNSIGVRAYSPTGLRADKLKIVRVGIGVNATGQCEGTLITNSTIFGVTQGIVLGSLTNPCNNHVISNTHISAYSKGISIQTPAVVVDLAISNFISKCFILERESGTNKSTEYVAIEMMARFSIISDTVIWSNTTTGTHDRIGIRMSPNANRAVSVSFNGSKYPFDIVSIAGSTEGSAAYADGINVYGAFTQVDKSANTNFVYTNTILSSVGASGINYQASSLRIRRTSGTNLFLANSGGITVGDTDSVNTTVNLKSATGSGSFDTRLLSIGGSTGSTTGQGDLQVTCSILRLNSLLLRPESDLTTANGSPSTRYSDTYSLRYRLGAGVAQLTSGTGSPEGVVTAVVGSMYTRTDGGANTTLYIKESGAAATGWVAK